LHGNVRRRSSPTATSTCRRRRVASSQTPLSDAPVKIGGDDIEA
jgi:hypothetical protein